LFISQKLPIFGELYFYMHMKNKKNNRYIKTYETGGGLSPAGYNAVSGLGSMVGDTISSIPSESGGVSMGASIAGGAVSGAAMGSVVPGIGTVIGGVIGAASGLAKGLLGKKAESRAIAKANHEAAVARERAEQARGQARLQLYEQNKGPELATLYKCGGKLKYANGGRIMIHTPYENGIVRGYYNGGIIPQEQAATINMKGMSDIKAGGTHQENPLGGVPIDNKNNFVEQGEFKYGKYVFSNRF
jgi:hypothetical protein